MASLEYQRQWHKEHPGKKAEYARAYRQKHKESLKLRRRRYFKEHKDRVQITNKKSYIKFRDLRKQEWLDILQKLGFLRCFKCGYDRCVAAIEYHHPDPKLKKGKTDTMARLFERKVTPERIQSISQCVPLCANCHRELHTNLKKEKTGE